MVSTMAFSLIGSMIPVVPRMEIPPSTPSMGLNVRRARSSPLGTDTVMQISSSRSLFWSASQTADSIILLGTRLMAGMPTSCSSPFFVTVPTPSPPSRRTPGYSSSRKLFSGLSCRNSARARISVPLVTSGSSPESFVTAYSAPKAHGSFRTGRETFCPSGSFSVISFRSSPVRRSQAAADAAAAAQVPVVRPHRSFFPFFSTCSFMDQILHLPQFSLLLRISHQDLQVLCRMSPVCSLQ